MTKTVIYLIDKDGDGEDIDITGEQIAMMSIATEHGRHRGLGDGVDQDCGVQTMTKTEMVGHDTITAEQIATMRMPPNTAATEICTTVWTKTVVGTRLRPRRRW